MCLFIVPKKRKRKRKQNPYKVRKIKEKENKNCSCPKHPITDIVENIGTKNIFTKMDLQWGYNNIWIKERDEWKIAFTTSEGPFKLTVMLFGLTNLPVTFQTMINEIL